MSDCASQPQPLRDQRCLVVVSGGIAAYKTAALVSRLVQAGATATVAMTDAAQRFVTPLTFQTLTGRPVYTSLWQAEENHDSQHVGLARSVDLVIIAPATANLIARVASGLCDDLPTTCLCALPREVPVLYAPAMNAQMWLNPITQRNVATLRDTLNWQQIGPETGWQACRTRGPGRMSDPQAIFDAAVDSISR
jgi:phosphopantothenoylcysteine decarboxylase/phosphopantothenate--cysteine ligase